MIYLYGETKTGKTRSVYDKYPISDICHITSYSGRDGVNFDNYHGQPVLLLEEFRSQIPMYLMLSILDIYPITLPSRYYDRVACFTTVYLTSNIPLEEQYKDVQVNEPETWKAFLRRINKVVEFRRGLPPKEVHYSD